MLPGGAAFRAALRRRREIYQAETYYTRGTRGERTDIVSITDALTLQPKGEVVIPPKRCEHTSWVAGSALSDDGRFFAVFNMNPGTSLSIVDVIERRFVAEIDTPGCSLVYAAGPRRFLSLCADGTALVDARRGRSRGVEAHTERRWFDPEGRSRHREGGAPRRSGSSSLRRCRASHRRFVRCCASPNRGRCSATPTAGNRGVGGMQQLALHAATGVSTH
jgi:hypothetical protein